MPPRMKSVKIKGYRPFRDFSAPFGPLEVIVGANGSGKSSLFEFLWFLRETAYRDSVDLAMFPDPESTRRCIFHSPGPQKISWDIEIDFFQDYPIRYQGELIGPVGNLRMVYESVRTVPPEGETPFLFMEIKEGKGFIQDPGSEKKEINLAGLNQLALRTVTDPMMKTLYGLREYIRGWRFYNSFSIDHDQVRVPTVVKQEPFLRENAANLSSFLLGVIANPPAFGELRQYLRSTIPGFRELRVKALGEPGEVMAFWQEDGVENDLTLADLSDGIIQLMCWAVLCVQPSPPLLICIDEPDQGVHPRTLPFLAGLFKKASDRTQILLATHSSYFLTLFDLSRIAVMRKEHGEAKFLKPKDSKALIEILKDFGPEEIENLHISDELEILA